MCLSLHTSTCACVYIYIYIYILVSDQKVNSCLYVTHVYMCLCLYIYIYILVSDQGKKVQFISTTPHRLRKRLSGSFVSYFIN